MFYQPVESCSSGQSVAKTVSTQSTGGFYHPDVSPLVGTHFEPDPRLAEEVVLWHCAVLEDDVAGGGGADAELVLLLAER